MKRRGRPRDPGRKIAIAEAVLVKRIPDEAKVLLGNKPKFGRYQTKPITKTIYDEVASEFGVTTRTVQEAVRLYEEESKLRLAKEITDRLDASDFIDRHERKRAIQRFLDEYKIEIK